MAPLPLISQAGSGALIASAHHCSLKFAQPVLPLFAKLRPKFNAVNRRGIRTPLTATNPEAVNSTDAATPSTSSPARAATVPSRDSDEQRKPYVPEVSFVGQEDVNLEGVIQFEKPNSSASLLAKWGLVALLAGGDVAALLLFATIGRLNHGFSVFDLETLKTADPFLAGWFLSAYFLGGYGDEGQGKNGLWKAVTAAGKSWSLGIPLGLMIRAVTLGHAPPTNFMMITMGSTAVLLIGWRALFFSIFPNDKSNKNKDDAYKKGSPFELFELLTSLVRRW